MADPVQAREIPAAAGLRRELNLRDVSLFAIACICGTRWIAAAAHAGPGAILLWVLAAIWFAIPLAIAIASLGAKYAKPGGFYWWTRSDFGPWHGFLCFWTYWMGIAFWFPSAAMFYMSMAAWTLGPRFGHLAESRAWLIAASLAAIWVALGANVVGLNAGKWTENAGALASWVLVALLAVAASAVSKRTGVATPFHVAPKLNWSTVNFWASIAYAMSGMELVALMAGEIRDTERTLPRAAAIASLFSMIFYAGATAAVLALVPAASISELTGLAQAGSRADLILGNRWIEPSVGALVLISAIGQFGGIGSATSRMPFALGVDRLLPKAFSRVHPRWRTPHVSILALGFFSSLLLVAVQWGDTARAAYDTMVSLTVIGGFIPYVYIFGSAWLAGKRLSAVSGLGVTVIAILCSAIPSSIIGNAWLFEAKLAAGTGLIILSGRLIYNRYARQSV